MQGLVRPVCCSCLAADLQQLFTPDALQSEQMILQEATRFRLPRPRVVGLPKAAMLSCGPSSTNSPRARANANELRSEYRELFTQLTLRIFTPPMTLSLESLSCGWMSRQWTVRNRSCSGELLPCRQT